MDRRNFLVVLVTVSLVVVIGVLRYQRRERLRSELQRLRESETLKIEANPLPHVRDGMAVEDVEKALGKGEKVADGGDDLLLWYGADGGQPWTLVVTVKHGQVFRPTMMRGGAGVNHEFRKQAAIGLHK